MSAYCLICDTETGVYPRTQVCHTCSQLPILTRLDHGLGLRVTKQPDGYVKISHEDEREIVVTITPLEFLRFIEELQQVTD